MSRAERSVFLPVIVAAILVALGGVLALAAARAARRFLPELNDADPALAEAPLRLGYAPPRASRRVVLVIVDGLRLRDSFGFETLDALRRRGVDAVAHAHYPTISRPNWVAILTGVPPAHSGVRNNWFDFEIDLDSLMDRARDAGLSATFSADYATSGGRMFADDFEDIHVLKWPGGLAKATGLDIDRDTPLVVLLPGEVDHAGHEYGADGPEYRAAIAQVDELLARVVAGIDLDRDTVIVTGDHGMTDDGAHGGTEPEVIEVPLIIAGAGVRPGAALAPVELVDIAPTAATLLGLPPPAHGFGRTLTEALTLSAGTRERVSESDRERIADNRDLAARRVANAARTLRRARIERGLIAVAAAVIAALALWALRRTGAIKIDWRVLAVSVPAFPLAYYAVLDVFFSHFSLSAIASEQDAFGRLFRFGLVSTAVQVVAAWIALQGRVVLRNRLAAANGVVWCGLMVALAQAGGMWTYFAAGPFEVPPSSAVSVLVPAMYTALACYAVAAAATLGLEIIVFFARAVDPRVRLRRLERAAERERERLDREPGSHDPTHRF